jgi:hypothetical protein
MLRIIDKHPVFYTCLIPVPAEVRISNRNTFLCFFSFSVASVDGFKSRSDLAALYKDVLFLNYWLAVSSKTVPRHLFCDFTSVNKRFVFYVIVDFIRHNT